MERPLSTYARAMGARAMEIYSSYYTILVSMSGVPYANSSTILPKSQEWLKGLGRRKRWPEPTGKAALLVLDMQNFFLVGGHAFIPVGKAIIPNIKELVSDFDGPVIFTRHVKDVDGNNLMNVWWSDSIEGEDAEIVKELLPLSKVVVEKHHYSAFYGTPLVEMLYGMGIDSVVISGVMTDLCCETTARDAFMRGFRVYFLADCTATATEERHVSSLWIISEGFGEVMTSEEWRSQ